MLKWSLFQWFCYGCLVVFVVNMALVGSALFALFALFGVWHGVRVVNRKFNCIDNDDLECLISCQKGEF